MPWLQTWFPARLSIFPTPNSTSSHLVSCLETLRDERWQPAPPLRHFHRAAIPYSWTQCWTGISCQWSGTRFIGAPYSSQTESAFRNFGPQRHEIGSALCRERVCQYGEIPGVAKYI